ncbi:MAG TPA: ABC transporter substrate-binding protein [Vicinamibacterales bacterium]|nr:ABC transporter substrate-binding protein [Vicinamibacterales bacterium]
MDRRRFLTTSVAGVLATTAGVHAQPTARIYRVGFLLTLPPGENVHLVNALEQGLRELGYLEGRNLVVERRSAEGSLERLPALAAELVRLNVDVIVTGSNPVIATVQRATTTIPVVMAVSRDPVGAGFVASLARPGANITGFANEATPEIIGKNLALLKEAVPGLSRVGFLWNPGDGTPATALEGAARGLNVSVQLVEIRRRNDLNQAFAEMVRQRVHGIVVAQEPITLGSRRQVVQLAAARRLPAMYGLKEFTDVGGLMSYGPNIADQFRRAAVYVDKILRGAKPGDLPVDQAARFELAINVKAAKTLGLTIPPSLLARADQVIE